MNDEFVFISSFIRKMIVASFITILLLLCPWIFVFPIRSIIFCSILLNAAIIDPFDHHTKHFFLCRASFLYFRTTEKLILLQHFVYRENLVDGSHNYGIWHLANSRIWQKIDWALLQAVAVFSLCVLFNSWNWKIIFSTFFRSLSLSAFHYCWFIKSHLPS